MNTNEALVIERVLNAPIEKVWKALTDYNSLKQWSFPIPDFKAEVGFEFRFLLGKDAESQYMHICKVTEVIPTKKIAYSWQFEGYEGYSEVSYELFDEGGATRIKLTHDGIASFPKNNPDFALGNFAEGWTYIIETALKGYVESV